MVLLMRRRVRLFVRLDYDVSDMSFVGSEQALVAVIFDCEVDAGAFA